MSSRLSNSVRNIKFGTIGLVISYVFSFITRKVFVVFLNIEYLGLNGLFSNILMMLSLAELGVGTAICYSLYKPLAFGDVTVIQALMQLYKKAYTLIGLLVLVIGLALTPLLPLLIKDIPDISNLDLIYCLFVVNSAFTYFLSYKRTIFIADQKKYIDSVYLYGFQILKQVLQISILVLFKDFVLFLLVMLVMTITENLAISHKADSMYPYLKDKVKRALSADTKHEIKKNVIALTFHKIGYVLVNGTDNILLVKFVDLASAGLYANYTMIQSAINGILKIFFTSITASIGNLSAEKQAEGSKPVFDLLNFISSWIYGFTAICLFFLFNPFITIWLGPEYLFDTKVVFIIVLNYYLTGMRQPVLTLRNTLGLFWFDRYKSIVEALVNLVVSIVLAIKIGMVGVLIGTTISTLATCFWIEPYVLYRFGFAMPLSQYFKKYIKFFLISLIAATPTYGAISLIVSGNLYLQLLINLLCCLLIPNLVYFLVYYQSTEFKEIILVFHRIFHNRIQTRKH